MITLSKHIEYLLLDNDCVIVPGLGGFIAHYQTSYYDDSNNTFKSPQRVIGFNPKLTMNDGLLVQSYMQSFQTDFSDANKRIDNEVCKLKDKLYNDGNVEIPRIGTLSVNIDNDYKFVPTVDIINAPTLYGLTSFCFNKIDLKKKKAIDKTKEYKISKDNTPSGINIGFKWAASIVAVAVAFIMFFFLSVPVENSYKENDNFAYLGDAGLIDNIKTKSFVTSIINNVKAKSSEYVKATKITSSVDSTLTNRNRTIDNRALQRENISSDKVSKKEISEEKPYHIIISTLHTEKAAEKALIDYQKRGYKDVAVIKGKTNYRLSLCNFDDIKSAYNKMNELRTKGEFIDSWVFCSK